ncbi:MAG: hypothetical protein ACPLRU_01135 [Desulfofundulus sp.]
MSNKLEKNRNRYTGDNFETGIREREASPKQRYCIEIKTGPREKVKLSFLYPAMRKELLEKLGQALEEIEIKLFTEKEGRSDGQTGRNA